MRRGACRERIQSTNPAKHQGDRPPPDTGRGECPAVPERLDRWNSNAVWGFQKTWLNDVWVTRWLRRTHGIPYLVIKTGNKDIQINTAVANIWATLSEERKGRAGKHTVVYCAVSRDTGYYHLWLEPSMCAGSKSHAGTPDSPDVCILASTNWGEWVEGANPSLGQKYAFFTHIYFHELCHAAGLPHCTGDANCIMVPEATNRACYAKDTLHVKDSMGFTRRMHARLAADYCKDFWRFFGSAAYKDIWWRNGWQGSDVTACAKQALDYWWEKSQERYGDSLEAYRWFYASDGMLREAYPRDSFVRVNNVDLE